MLTAKGQLSVAQEAELLRAIERIFTAGITCVPTPKNGPARVDGALVKAGVIEGVFETKCRDASRAQMREWGDEWLLTFDKLLDGANVARGLGVPLFGFLYLLRDRTGLALRLADADGYFLPAMRLARTETQATCNGGKIIRTNAYVSLAKAREFSVPPIVYNIADERAVPPHSLGVVSQ